MREITVLDKTYQVPSFAKDRFLVLQERLRAYQREIARLSRRRGFPGMVRGRRAAASIQHWLQVMDGIIDHYEGAMEELRRDIGRYQEFFTALSLDVREAFRQRAAELAEMERERGRLAHRAREQGDRDLYVSLEVERKQQLEEMVLNLMKSAVLILRKIQVSWDALSRLAADRGLQEEVLGELSAQLRLYRDVLRFDRRLKQLQHEVARFAQIAVRFDRIIAENVDPLHALFVEVGSVDEHIARSLNEMERLNIELSTNPVSAGAPLGATLEEVLRQLVRFRVSQELFDDAFRLVAEQDSSAEEVEFRTLEAEDDLMASIATASRLVERHVDLLLEGGKADRPPAGGGAASAPRRERGPGAPPAAGGGSPGSGAVLRQVLVTAGLLSAAPCLHRGSLYVGDQGGSLYCLDAGGGLRWRALLPAGIYAPAAVLDDSCLVGSRSGEVFCLQAASGQQRWSFQTSGRIEAAATVQGGRAFVGSLDGILYCLEVEDGSLRWRFAAGSAIPWEAVLAEGVLYFVDGEGGLVGLEIEEGRQVLALRAGAPLAGAPAVAGGNVALAGRDGRLHAVQAAEGRTAWTLGIRGVKLLAPVAFTEPGSGGGALAVQGSDGILRLVSPEDGAVVSAINTGAAGPLFPPSVHGRMACAQRGPRALALLDLQSRQILWSANVSESPLLRPVLAEGAIAAADRMGRVYLGAWRPPEPGSE